MIPAIDERTHCNLHSYSSRALIWISISSIKPCPEQRTGVYESVPDSLSRFDAYGVEDPGPRVDASEFINNPNVKGATYLLNI